MATGKSLRPLWPKGPPTDREVAPSEKVCDLSNYEARYEPLKTIEETEEFSRAHREEHLYTMVVAGLGDYGGREITWLRR